MTTPALCILRAEIVGGKEAVLPSRWLVGMADLGDSLGAAITGDFSVANQDIADANTEFAQASQVDPDQSPDFSNMAPGTNTSVPGLSISPGTGAPLEGFTDGPAVPAPTDAPSFQVTNPDGSTTTVTGVGSLNSQTGQITDSSGNVIGSATLDSSGNITSFSIVGTVDVTVTQSDGTSANAAFTSSFGVNAAQPGGQNSQISMTIGGGPCC
jgi:hypothetical protein